MKLITFLLLTLLIIIAFCSCNDTSRDLPDVDLSSVSDEPLYYMYNKLLLPNSSAANEVENELPLPKYGMFGLEELNRTLPKIKNDKIKKHFETGYRYIFTIKHYLRNLKKAKKEFEIILETDKKNCYGHYGLALANLLTPSKHRSFLELGLSYLLQTVKLNPHYGEAHYVLAVIFSFFDKPKSFSHYKKALSLGIKDEKKIGEANFDDIYHKR